ncbi:hypothetical protein BCR37DRAFT_380322 [Protomyces lactucae-debilis]|uniref:ubiquitinyl hydrolase 1 n=1 Tax=Protomyces lactucae-debilis TaxID=2754530 RepID=A0A1Y2FBX4_PROLT|nr:uncharacterized protein BCR37DRAFT_380322 [Protomyces lactucae-debilis]ORY81420.1 hypothetical protein BCR37DRAFT_380322 [Protomyces lactucae-debilis]
MHLDAANGSTSFKRARTMSTPNTDDTDGEAGRPFQRELSQTTESARFHRPNDNERPSALEQRMTLESLEPEQSLALAQEAGQPHFLVPKEWWVQYQNYLSGDGPEPGLMDLSLLEEEEGTDELKADLTADDYISISGVDFWSQLQQWYGEDGLQIKRHAVATEGGAFELELHPAKFHFSYYTPPDKFTDVRTLRMYSHKDVDGLYEKVKHMFQVPEDHQIRFWHTSSNGLAKLEHLKSAITRTHDNSTVGKVTDGSNFLIVESRASGRDKWPLDTVSKEKAKPQRVAGTKGLVNLGNTCYMASALQCLSHIKELTEYFLSTYYQEELNTDNPLGYNGQVATAFARLLEQLYNDDNGRAVRPAELKSVLGNINQSFGGYQQQDSQELLAFLLDALHEDLNRIVKKPATERPDIGKVNDDELLQLGEEAWRLHKMRNDSVIVDLFQGVYKSTLVCPVCAHVSVTFDPFSDLSLPLPFQSYWTHDVFFVPLQGPPVKINLEFDQNASIGHLIAYFSKRFGIPTDRITGAEIWKGKIYKAYFNYMPVTVIETADVAYFYELSKPDPRLDKESKSLLLPVYTFKSDRKQVASSHPEPAEHPFLVIMDEAESCSIPAIQQKLLAQYARFTTSTDLTTTEFADEEEDEGFASDDDELTRPAAPNKPAFPFTVKVGQYKGTTYGGPRPEPLSSRRKPRALPPRPPRRNLIMPESDSLPPYSAGSIGPSPISDVDTDSGMKDASDEENPAVKNSLLVEQYFITPEIEPDTVDVTLDAQDDLLGTSDPPTDFSATGALADLPSDTAMADPEAETEAVAEASPAMPLLRNGDAFFCEWPVDIYEQIFSNDPESIGGQSLWEKFDEQHDEAMDAQRLQREATKDKVKSLEDCLDEFAKEEPLDAENTWYCPKCKEHQRANKTFELWRTGDILVFHLKRFSSSRSLSDKIDAEIRFPVKGLELNDRLGERRLRLSKGEKNLENSIYDLCGVVNHYGGLGGGHYTAFAQTFDDGNFHNFNDSSVNAMDANNLVSSSAYLLFYRRRADKPLGGELYSKIEQHAEQRLVKQQSATASLNLIRQRDSSVPLASAPSSLSDSSNEARLEPLLHVPFSGPGRQLGGTYGDVKAPLAQVASNPFGTSTWGSGLANNSWTLQAASDDSSERPNSATGSDKEWNEDSKA